MQETDSSYHLYLPNHVNSKRWAERKVREHHVAKWEWEQAGRVETEGDNGFLYLRHSVVIIAQLLSNILNYLINIFFSLNEECRKEVGRNSYGMGKGTLKFS